MKDTDIALALMHLPIDANVNDYASVNGCENVNDHVSVNGCLHEDHVSVLHQ